MATLYVTEPGARLEKEHQRLLVTLNDEVILQAALNEITEVALVGNAGVTTPALYSLLEKGIPLILLARSGKLLGRLVPPQRGNIALRQAQYRRNEEPAYCLEIARAIVLGKLQNERCLAKRIARREEGIDPQQVERIERAIEQIPAAETIAALMGVEGSAAKAYFAVIRQALAPGLDGVENRTGKSGASWAFTRRVRRPPKDPVNALLSLGYSLLGHAARSALELVGLDPFLGYFHQEKYNRPALALDLIEEFRSPVVDSLVLDILNHERLKEEDFEVNSESGGVLLSLPGLREFLGDFSQKLDSTVFVRSLKRSLSYRKLIEVQARRMRRAIETAEPYRAFQAR